MCVYVCVCVSVLVFVLSPLRWQKVSLVCVGSVATVCARVYVRVCVCVCGRVSTLSPADAFAALHDLPDPSLNPSSTNGGHLRRPLTFTHQHTQDTFPLSVSGPMG